MNSKLRFARTSAVILLGAVSLWSAGCGVSKSKYADLQKNFDAEAAKNKQCATDLATANKDKDEIQNEKTALETQVNDLKAHAEQIGSKLEESQKASEEMKATYESLVGNLKGELSTGKVEVQQLRDGISVNLAQDILFKSGSAELDKAGKDLLVKLTDQLKTSPFQVAVTGHTDNQKIGAGLAARYPTNWELGAARASRIVRLFEENGIAKDRLAAVSFADSRPRESNDTPDGRAKNRRIEIRLRPVPAEQSAGTDQ